MNNRTINVFLLDELVNDVPVYDGKSRNVFSKEIRNQVLERDNHKCCMCSVSDGYLVVHHIIPRGESVISNGIALCTDCHICVHVLLSFFKGYPYYTPYEVREWRYRGSILRFAIEQQERMEKKHEKEMVHMKEMIENISQHNKDFYEYQIEQLWNSIEPLYKKIKILSGINNK